MMPYTNLHWQRFFTEVGAPELARDARFVDIASRTRHIAELLELASGFTERHTTAHWIAVCERLEIPAAPVAKLQDLPLDPHLVATDFFETVADPALDRCGGRVSSCQKRFAAEQGVSEVAAIINFGGQPAADTLRG